MAGAAGALEAIGAFGAVGASAEGPGPVTCAGIDPAGAVAGHARLASHRAWAAASTSPMKMPMPYPATPKPAATSPTTKADLIPPSINRFPASPR